MNDDEIEPGVVARTLGWCECGCPERIDGLMLQFLLGVERRWTWERMLDEQDSGLPRDRYERPDKPTFPYGMDEDIAYTYAYLADDAGWTTHGGAVGGEWLNDEGKDVIVTLKAMYPEVDAAKLEGLIK